MINALKIIKSTFKNNLYIFPIKGIVLFGTCNDNILCSCDIYDNTCTHVSRGFELSRYSIKVIT